MDNIQIKAIDAIRAHKDLITDRNKFKGMLSDYLNEDKLHVNLLMYAYDEKFPIRIKNETEKIATAGRYVKILAENYGISKELAQWSVVTWIAVLGYGDEAIAVQEMSFSENSENHEKRSWDDEKECIIGVGIYCAGIDFPAGTIALQSKWNDGSEKNVILYGINSNPNNLEWTESFVDKTYLSIKEGDFLRVEPDCTGVEEELIGFVVRKVRD